MSTERPAGMLSLLGFAAGTAPIPQLVRALGELGFDGPLWCATTSAVSVGSDGTAVDPEQALQWGLGRVAAAEFPDRWGGLVDLPKSLDASVLGSLGAVLSHADEDQVALRHDGVFVRRIQRLGRSGADPWRASGTVLVTGADGAMGQRLAKWLAEAGADRVVLAGPEAVAAEWRDAGVAATVRACDVGDRVAVAHLLDGIDDDHPLTAVVHVVGTQAEVALPDIDRDELLRAAAGASNLDHLLGARHLNAFVLISPATGMWGAAGGSTSAAASAYFAGLAQRRRSLGLAATAIGWDMLSEMGTGTRPMDPDAALAAIEHAVESGEAEALIAAIDWDQPESVLARTRAGSLFADLPEFRRMRAHHDQAAKDHSSLRSELAMMTPEDQERTLVELIRSEIAAVLRYDSVDDIEPTSAFLELGLDSISGLQIRKRLATATGLELSVRMVIEQPTTLELAGYLRARIAEQPDAMGTMPADRLEV